MAKACIKETNKSEELTKEKAENWTSGEEGINVQSINEEEEEMSTKCIQLPF